MSTNLLKKLSVQEKLAPTNLINFKVIDFKVFIKNNDDISRIYIHVY